jgi:hypothetical protein
MSLLYSEPESQTDSEASRSPPSKMAIFPGASGFEINAFHANQGGVHNYTYITQPGQSKGNTANTFCEWLD